MAGRIPQSFSDELTARADIVELGRDQELQGQRLIAIATYRDGLQRFGDPAQAGVPDAFASWSYEWAEPVERDVVMGMLRTAGVLRAKGIVRFAETPARRSVIHQVGSRLDIADDEPWHESETSRLVLLGLRPMLGSLQREWTTWPGG